MGHLLGFDEGELLGVRVVGELVLGFVEGALLGYRLGISVGNLLGFDEGKLLGFRLGFTEGALLGYRLGTSVGYWLGFLDGVEGATDGFVEGILVTGLQLGMPEDGEIEGLHDGSSVAAVGAILGL